MCILRHAYKQEAAIQWLCNAQRVASLTVYGADNLTYNTLIYGGITDGRLASKHKRPPRW